jgi:hypothetical protein
MSDIADSGGLHVVRRKLTWFVQGNECTKVRLVTEVGLDSWPPTLATKTKCRDGHPKDEDLSLGTPAMATPRTKTCPWGRGEGGRPILGGGCFPLAERLICIQ